MIILGLGTNLGKREQNLQQALKLLVADGTIRLDRVSSLYETAPFGVIDQPDFLNMVVSLKTDLSPQELLHKCLHVENELGRIRTRHWGPRIIDIDLLFFDEVQLQSEELTLPHPGILQRAFVVLPLRDLVPSLRLENGRTVMDMALEFEQLGGSGVRIQKKVEWDSVAKCFVRS